MLSLTLDTDARKKAFSSTLRGLRRLRGLRVGDAAAAMGMPLRSYQHFEAGQARLNVEHLLLFADKTDTDGVALIASVLLQSPDLALACADNKMMSILLFSTGEFYRTVGAEMASLTAGRLITALKAMFDALALELQRPDAAKTWLAERTARLAPASGSAHEPQSDE